MGEVRYRAGRRGDLIGIGQVYLRAFSITLEQLAAPALSPQAVADGAGACLLAEPDGIGVAEVEGRVVGYIIAVLEVNRVRSSALWRGLPLVWLWRWLRGRYGLPLGAVRHVISDKLSFWRAARLPGARCPRILSIAVDPDWQGRGVAKGLLPPALARLRARGCDCVRLEVRPENEAALRLYRGFGFEVVGRYADSRGPWEVMTLQLDRTR
jgi:ribosomal protein S18 acetylase RimI-like enzyme